MKHKVGGAPEKRSQRLSPKGRPAVVSPPSCHKALKGQKVFLDLRGYRGQANFECDLKLLGGVIEKCFSKDVTCVITNKGQPKDYERPKGKGISQSVSSPTTPSPFNVANFDSPTAGSPSQTEAVKKPMTRGIKALAQAAKANKGYGSTDVVESARRWNIRIVHIQNAQKWVKKELEKLPAALREGATSQVKNRKQNSKVAVRRLKGNIIKFEAIKRIYRPVRQEFDQFPKIHFNSPYGSCPFERGRTFTGNYEGALDRAEGDLEEREERDEEGVAGGGHISSQTASKSRDKKLSTKDNKNTSDGYGTTKIYTAGDIQRLQKEKARLEQKKGFCEMCYVKYDNIDKHVQSEQHRNFVRNASNFEALDRMIEKGPNIAQFLDDVLKYQNLHANQANNQSEEDDILLLQESSPVIIKRKLARKSPRHARKSEKSSIHVPSVSPPKQLNAPIKYSSPARRNTRQAAVQLGKVSEGKLKDRSPSKAVVLLRDLKHISDCGIKVDDDGRSKMSTSAGGNAVPKIDNNLDPKERTEEEQASSPLPVDVPDGNESHVSTSVSSEIPIIGSQTFSDNYPGSPILYDRLVGTRETIRNRALESPRVRENLLKAGWVDGTSLTTPTKGSQESEVQLQTYPGNVEGVVPGSKESPRLSKSKGNDSQDTISTVLSPTRSRREANKEVRSPTANANFEIMAMERRSPRLRRVLQMGSPENVSHLNQDKGKPGRKPAKAKRSLNLPEQSPAVTDGMKKDSGSLPGETRCRLEAAGSPRKGLRSSPRKGISSSEIAKICDKNKTVISTTSKSQNLQVALLEDSNVESPSPRKGLHFSPRKGLCPSKHSKGNKHLVTVVSNPEKQSEFAKMNNNMGDIRKVGLERVVLASIEQDQSIGSAASVNSEYEKSVDSPRSNASTSSRKPRKNELAQLLDVYPFPKSPRKNGRESQSCRSSSQHGASANRLCSPVKVSEAKSPVKRNVEVIPKSEKQELVIVDSATNGVTSKPSVIPVTASPSKNTRSQCLQDSAKKQFLKVKTPVKNTHVKSKNANRIITPSKAIKCIGLEKRGSPLKLNEEIVETSMDKGNIAKTGEASNVGLLQGHLRRSPRKAKPLINAAFKVDDRVGDHSKMLMPAGNIGVVDARESSSSHSATSQCHDGSCESKNGSSKHRRHFPRILTTGKASSSQKSRNKKKVKLKHNWSVLSDRSMLKLLSSESDVEIFEGFGGNCAEKRDIPTDLTYVDVSEVEIYEEDDIEWVFNSDIDEQDVSLQPGKGLNPWEAFPMLLGSPVDQTDPSSEWDANMDQFVEEVCQKKVNETASVSSFSVTSGKEDEKSLNSSFIIDVPTKSKTPQARQTGRRSSKRRRTVPDVDQSLLGLHRKPVDDIEPLWVGPPKSKSFDSRKSSEARNVPVALMSPPNSVQSGSSKAVPIYKRSGNWSNVAATPGTTSKLDSRHLHSTPVQEPGRSPKNRPTPKTNFVGSPRRATSEKDAGVRRVRSPSVYKGRQKHSGVIPVDGITQVDDEVQFNYRSPKRKVNEHQEHKMNVLSPEGSVDCQVIPKSLASSFGAVTDSINNDDVTTPKKHASSNRKLNSRSHIPAFQLKDSRSHCVKQGKSHSQNSPLQSPHRDSHSPKSSSYGSHTRQSLPQHPATQSRKRLSMSPLDTVVQQTPSKMRQNLGSQLPSPPCSPKTRSVSQNLEAGTGEGRRDQGKGVITPKKINKSSNSAHKSNQTAKSPSGKRNQSSERPRASPNNRKTCKVKSPKTFLKKLRQVHGSGLVLKLHKKSRKPEDLYSPASKKRKLSNLRKSKSPQGSRNLSLNKGLESSEPQTDIKPYVFDSSDVSRSPSPKKRKRTNPKRLKSSRKSLYSSANERCTTLRPEARKKTYVYESDDDSS